GDPRIPEELRKLRGYLPEEVKLYVGGRAAESYETSLAETGAAHLGSLADFRRELSR
ncbi:MAG: transcriptional regulator, partial [Myxococcales bacterium]